MVTYRRREGAELEANIFLDTSCFIDLTLGQENVLQNYKTKLNKKIFK